MQLSLSLFGSGRLRPAVEDYLATQCDGLAEGTIDDYLERANWLYRAFGEWTHLDELDYPKLYRCSVEWGPKGRGLRQVTLKKRLNFLRCVIRHAHGMGLCEKPEPNLPKLRDDGARGENVHDRRQYQAFRSQLPPGRFRDLADLAYWTGHHRFDLFDTRRRHFDLFFDWGIDGHKGAFWRRNHKNKRCKDCWFPLEPEAVPVISDMLSRVAPDPDALITGKVWNIPKTFHKAADRAEVPRVSLLRLRSSMASRLLADEYPHEYVRLALGHTGEVAADGTAKQSTTLSRHYARMTSDIVRGIPRSTT